MSTVGAVIGDGGDVLEEIGHDSVLDGGLGGAVAGVACVEGGGKGADGVDGAGDGRQGGDLGPGARWRP